MALVCQEENLLICLAYHETLQLGNFHRYELWVGGFKFNSRL